MNKLGSLLPKALLPSTIATKKIVREFAERSGMVYFGYVSQRNDDHHILRGLTVSTDHSDDHYCIGTYESYDVVFVERTDTLRSGQKHLWHIIEFDLKTKQDIPHIFIGSGNHGKGFHELLKIKYPSLQPIPVGITQPYPATFSSAFSLYANAGNHVSVEHVITPEIATMIATHFKGLVIEITDQSLYVYSEKSHLTESLLDTMLQNGQWLAAQIDEKSRQNLSAG